MNPYTPRDYGLKYFYCNVSIDDFPSLVGCPVSVYANHIMLDLRWLFYKSSFHNSCCLQLIFQTEVFETSSIYLADYAPSNWIEMRNGEIMNGLCLTGGLWWLRATSFITGRHTVLYYLNYCDKKTYFRRQVIYMLNFVLFYFYFHK